jgi:hypothetical protein
MDLSLFGFKINLEILILIGIIYLITIIHTFCGCCKIGLIEGLENMDDIKDKVSSIDPSGAVVSSVVNKAKNSDVLLGTQLGSGNIAAAGASVAGKIKDSASGTKEGFTGANINYGQSSPFDISKDNPINSSSWFASDLSVIPGKTLSPGVQEILNRPQQPLPLSEGEMLLFANTQFKPECCPNSYSSSSGCACMTTEQYNYLKLRGSNNVPYSEY